MHGVSSRGAGGAVAATKSFIPARAEVLETRRLMAAVYPSAGEQYLLELVNRARADPAAEAARAGVELNEGLAAGTISAAAKQPLAFDPQLGDAARHHTGWMLDTGSFTHDEAGTAPPGQMRAAGYVFRGAWRWGQNIWWHGPEAPQEPPLYPTIATIHRELFVDAGVAGRGHRVDLLTDAFKEVGVAALRGSYAPSGATLNVVAVTEDFAARKLPRRGAFLTGVAYRDADGDAFYTPGEGLGGVTVTATRVGRRRAFTATTGDAGGYCQRLPKGTYRVTASGDAVAAAQPILVKIRGRNVKVDFGPGGVVSAPPTR
jgi:uncharacterized protein YkwD